MAKAKVNQKERAGFATAADEAVEAVDISARVWKIASLSILIIATLLRVYHLSLKPLHHDEGVNGFFLTRLVREGVYQYDPGNYHGPTIYYFGLAATYLLGLNTIAIRLVTVAFGVATVWLALCLRRYVGSVGALAAAVLIAISPGAVYLSRYFIHESMVVFFTFGIIVALLKYQESEPPLEENRISGLIALIAGTVLVASSLAAVYRPQYMRAELLFIIVSAIVTVQALWHYDGKRSVYLILASVCAALLFASKETALVSVTVLGIALTTTAIYLRMRQKREKRTDKRKVRSVYDAEPVGWLATTMEKLGGPKRIGIMLFAGFMVFAFINILFYSSFFTNAKGVVDSLKTYMIWASTGKQEHVHPFYQHAYWLVQMESPVLMLGLLGAFLAVMRANNRFALFAAQWAFGLLAAYSIVPYKTPWLALNFIVPLAVTGGYAINEIYSWNKEEGEQRFLLLVLALAIAVNGYQTIKLNFFHYDDDKYIYVYGHTYREFLPMVDEIKRLGQKSGLKEEIDIAVLSPDYWPLPWYLNDFKRIGYYGRVSPTSSALVIINASQEQEMLELLGSRYTRINSYPLRPGVMLVLYVRNDLPLQ